MAECVSPRIILEADEANANSTHKTVQENLTLYKNASDINTDSQCEDEEEKEAPKCQTSETYKMFTWIEDIVGSRFRNGRHGNGSSFFLEEFELGKDGPNDDDILRSSAGEGMVVPLNVSYVVGERKQSSNLLLYLPQYYVDTIQELENGETFIRVQTHETFFFSKVVPDLQKLLDLKKETDITLPLPECFYVKHCEEYDSEPTPAQVGNLMKAKSLLVLADLTKLGFKEIDKVEDVNAKVAKAVVNSMARLHALCYCFEKKQRRPLTELWEQLPTMVKQTGINKHIIESSFDYFDAELDDEDSDDLYVMLLLERSKIEEIIRKSAMAAKTRFPQSVLHMMIGGPNLFVRRTESDEIDCAFTNWSLATIGNPVMDLALFTCVSMSPSMRKYHIEDLQKSYWYTYQQTLSLFEESLDMDYNDFCKEFKRQQLWSFLFMVAACKESRDLKTEEVRDILETLTSLVKELSPQECTSSTS